MSSPGVPLSDFPGRTTQDLLLRRARIFLVLAVVFGGGLAFGVVSYAVEQLTDGNGLRLREWLLGLPGGLLCAGGLGFGLYAHSRRLRRDATRRLWLDGTRLTITYWRGRQEFDLANTVCDVKLMGGTKSPYTPHLFLDRGPDRVPLDLELYEPFTRTLRPPGELLALANAMRHSPHQRTRDAAGRLRTIAGWTALPVIHAADRDAIPVTPDPGDQVSGTAGSVAPTPVRLAEPGPEVALPAAEPVNPVRRTLVDLALVAVAAVLVMLGLTVASATQALDAFDDGDREGQATATGCTRSGPISRAGFGYWYTCTAEVVWADGQRETETFRSSVLTESDIGTPVPVHEISGGRSSTDRIVRVDDPPNGWGLALLLPLFFIALVCLLRPVVDLVGAVFRLGGGRTGRA